MKEKRKSSSSSFEAASPQSLLARPEDAVEEEAEGAGVGPVVVDLPQGGSEGGALVEVERPAAVLWSFFCSFVFREGPTGPLN